MESVQGTGFFITFPSPSDALQLPATITIDTWSDEIEHAIRRHGVGRVSIADWRDGTHGIDFLARCIPQIQELYVADPRVGNLSVISQPPENGILRLQGLGKSSEDDSNSEAF